MLSDEWRDLLAGHRTQRRLQGRKQPRPCTGSRTCAAPAGTPQPPPAAGARLEGAHDAHGQALGARQLQRLVHVVKRLRVGGQQGRGSSTLLSVEARRSAGCAAGHAHTEGLEGPEARGLARPNQLHGPLRQHAAPAQPVVRRPGSTWSNDCSLLVRLLPDRSRPPEPVYRNCGGQGIQGNTHRGWVQECSACQGRGKLPRGATWRAGVPCTACCKRGHCCEGATATAVAAHPLALVAVVLVAAGKEEARGQQSMGQSCMRRLLTKGAGCGLRPTLSRKPAPCACWLPSHPHRRPPPPALLTRPTAPRTARPRWTGPRCPPRAGSARPTAGSPAGPSTTRPRGCPAAAGGA